MKQSFTRLRILNVASPSMYVLSDTVPWTLSLVVAAFSSLFFGSSYPLHGERDYSRDEMPYTN